MSSSGDVRLKIGERQNQIGLQRGDLGNIGRREGRDARLLAPRLRRPHHIAGDADDAILLAEQIQRLDGLLGQADDALGREHADSPLRPQSSNGSFIRIVSSRSGLVESSVTGHSISSSMRLTYLIACAGSCAHERAPAVDAFQPSSVS